MSGSMVSSWSCPRGLVSARVAPACVDSAALPIHGFSLRGQVGLVVSRSEEVINHLLHTVFRPAGDGEKSVHVAADLQLCLAWLPAAPPTRFCHILGLPCFSIRFISLVLVPSRETNIPRIPYTIPSWRAEQIVEAATEIDNRNRRAELAQIARDNLFGAGEISGQQSSRARRQTSMAGASGALIRYPGGDSLGTFPAGSLAIRSEIPLGLPRRFLRGFARRVRSAPAVLSYFRYAI